jgi:methyl-accepting chemotaxis protein
VQSRAVGVRTIEDHAAAEGFSACRPQRSVVGAAAPVVKETLIYFLKSDRPNVRGLEIADDGGVAQSNLKKIISRNAFPTTGRQHMLQWRSNAGARSALAQVDAISKSQAVIEFNMDGTIITANQNFLNAMGYTLEEIQGKHHGMFVTPAMREGAAYRNFWADLNRGAFQSGEYKRLGKGGREVWIQGSYNPILGHDGKPFKVVKFASDITAQKIRGMEDGGKVEAIGRSQAVIEFNMDGTIITANPNFLGVMGYRLEEIQGKHHSLFVEPAVRDSAAYREFWASLNRGEFQSAEYKRIGKGGKEVWILATYNPILDDTGKPFKVVKFASDVREQKLRAANFSGQVEAIGKSQAVIEFNMDGSVLTANDNFLRVLGYSLAEIKSRHHSMFVDPSERDGAAYREFWAALNRGEYQSGEYKRIGKGGKEVWIQASYNPILDLNGKPFKVVKYATDTTAQVIVRMKNERVRSMMESVAAGAEELNASVREISEAMVKSKNTAMSAVSKVESADQQAQRLSAAAQAMSGIVELIGNITGQINLLALNATIESARAGEAGRGFAVVASEVKNLANQAKQATDKITSEIDSLNGISSEVVGALGAIRQEIQDVSEYVTATAAAVEEQSTVTSEMSSSMQRAAAEAASIGQAA